MPDTNSVDGTVVGAVVQAGTISGGVHLHLPRPEAPRQLTAPPRLFVGRDAELAELHAAAEAPLVVLTGPGGVGKTTLARRWAYDVMPRFPDGQLYIDLQGFSEATAVDPGEALGYLLRALGVPAERVPAAVAEQSARYRSLTAGRALLIVLDNAFSVAQVRQLLPGAGPSLVLVTSRRRLAGLVAEGCVTVEVRPWPVADSVALLERALGPDRVDRERAHAVALTRICGGLPIALAVVAARLSTRPRLPLARLVAELTEETSRLRGLHTAEGVSVLGSLDLSYQDLPHPVRSVYRRLAVLPGREYGPDPIAVLAESVERAGSAIDILIQANLLEEVDADRFRQHDLLFLHARERFAADEAPAERERAGQGCLEWYLAAATAAERVLTPYRRCPFSYAFSRRPLAVPAFPGRAPALQWLDDERPSLIAAGRAALEHGWNDLAWHLADVLWPLLLFQKHYRDRISIDECGLTAAQRWGNRWAEADMRKRLGRAYAEEGRLAEAEEQLRLAAGNYREFGDPLGGIDAEEHIASLYRDAGRESDAIAMYRRVLDANRATGEPRRVGLTLIRLGALLTSTGAPAEAVEHLVEARTVFRELAAVDPYNGQRVEIALARAYLARGALAEATAAAEHSAAGMRRLGSKFEEAQAVEVLAEAAHLRGNAEDSRRHWAQALDLYEELQSPRAQIVRGKLSGPAVVENDRGEPG